MYRLKETFNGLLGKTYVFETEGGGSRYWVTSDWAFYYKNTYSRKNVSVADWNILSNFNLTQSIRSFPRKRNTVAGRSEGQAL